MGGLPIGDFYQIAASLGQMVAPRVRL